MKTKTVVYSIIFLVTNMLYSQTSKQEPLNLASVIVDRIIRETSFELKDVELKPALDIQVIDFKKAKVDQIAKYISAESSLNVTKDTKVSFGISSDHPIKILIDDKVVLNTKKSRKFRFAEVAYEIFDFQDYFSTELKSGEHKIEILSLVNKPAKVYLREISEPGLQLLVRFTSHHQEENPNSTWCFKQNLKGQLINYNNCFIVPIEKVKQLTIPSTNTYKRESFAEWQYPNGSLLMSILDLSAYSEKEEYKSFVSKCADFTIENYPLFKKQYFEQNDFRGTNHKMFRKTMLDDTGSPSLHLLQLALVDKTKKYDLLITEMNEYITKKQVRLADGTFCRPEPEKYVVWADDLFMSVPFLLRMAAATKNIKYYDDAIQQIVNMNKYLLNSEKELYHHAWYDYKKEQSPVLWGRSNGWIIWAESEALKLLPKNHKSYSAIQKIYKEHLLALIKVQGVNGLWHQVLDDNTSFEETSCTAMFTIGLIRAIDLGILDSSYKVYVDKAWLGLKSRISEDGIVKDICRGTGVSDDINFYKTRERFPNDPRGLGSVVTALFELARFYSK